MSHVVTQSCCNDASCVFACPVNCIHPTPDEPDFARAEMLYIDPATCVDCGACVSACPTGAIVHETRLDADERGFLDLNAEFYAQRRPPHPVLAVPPVTPMVDPDRGRMRVAIVGSGPAAMYAADELLAHPTGQRPQVRVDMFERLAAPYGLVRYGVAPDHIRTKRIAEVFDRIRAREGFFFHSDTEVGRDISHEYLRRRYHAVVYAVGARDEGRLDIPGIDLPGVASATDFVAWYNGHPDQYDRDFGLSGRRAVVIGNGNVALDVARMLIADPNRAMTEDISPTAANALRRSTISEVVIAGRRGPAQAACTIGELSGLLSGHGYTVEVNPEEVGRVVGPIDYSARRKVALLRSVGAGSSARRSAKRIVLRFQLAPVAVLGTDRVAGVEFTRTALALDGDRVSAVRTGEIERLDADLVLTSVGYRGTPIGGLPFDDTAGVIPNEEGRVHPGVYVAGWIKRGPTGFIGTNKTCARETVRSMVADFNAGLLCASTA